MTNFLPLEGALVPRSRLSSVNTVRVPGGSDWRGMATLTRADLGNTTVWISAHTRHALVNSTGSISRASFVSSFGLGVGSLFDVGRWQYAQAFMGNINENALLAVPRYSADTILAIYQTSGSATGLPLCSYLTSAPMACAVGAWNNYVIAFNTLEGGSVFASRVRWSVRGNPSNWTSEGSGFEDLLEMRGQGQAVIPTADGRVLLFTDLETWYATPATYPAQFDFQALDHEIGCPHAETIARTDQGILFIGNDHNLRLLPNGGGKSQVVFPGLTKYIKSVIGTTPATGTWAVYDPYTRLYHLFLETIVIGQPQYNFVVNIATGEWGYMEYCPFGPNNTSIPLAGVQGRWTSSAWPGVEGIFYVNSFGTVFSTSSKLGTENASGVTATWRSAPIAPELAGNYKQLTKVCVDYRATSKSTITLKLSQDGGNTFEATGRLVSLPSALASGRVESDVYAGGAFPALELTSQSTGYELHRLDVSMTIGGRK